MPGMQALKSQKLEKLRSPNDFLVMCKSATKVHEYDLVLKEPQGRTRVGTAGVGLRAVGIYHTLGAHLPVRIPELIVNHPRGDWLLISRLPEGRRPEHWQESDYILAIDQLVALHDRFWGLGKDLAAYPWLGRPLDADFNIHIQAAANGLQKLIDRDPATKLSKDTDLHDLLDLLISQAAYISMALNRGPGTLLHGDYWPGNILVHHDRSITIFDWEHASIGPCILDLLFFVKSSEWWFDPLPIKPEDIVSHYRDRMKQTNGHVWNDEEWQRLWEFALLWTFISGWIDLLANIPDSVLETRHSHLEKLWMEPVRNTAVRLLPRF
jgi:hypothetical protein